MAGRRRKKRQPKSESMDVFKPELVFIESPIDGAKHYSTPVQAARNPFLAPSVSVDQEISGKWVSPQFQTQLESHNNESFAAFGTRRKCRTRNTADKGILTQRTAKTIEKGLFAPLDFCTDNPSKNATKVGSSSHLSLRRSCRLKKKQQNEGREHFLFEEENRTPKQNSYVVLAVETPDENLTVPAVLRRLRSKTHLKTET